ncbi:hypothetical protein KKE60_06875 [Patescibacteria group bacterium]|nr:hypothetical protein [Patescibacteria group bacterium]
MSKNNADKIDVLEEINWELHGCNRGNYYASIDDVPREDLIKVIRSILLTYTQDDW